MSKDYDIFERTIPKKHLKNHKLRKINFHSYLDYYNELTYQLYKLKLKQSNNLETISKLEFKLMDYEQQYHLKSTEKIDAILAALERYYTEIKLEENLNLIKRRGLYIYEDLSYKLHKLKNTTPLNIDKIRKIELKLKECQTKYNLSDLEQIDAKIKSLEKYSKLLSKKEEDRQKGLSTYKNLIYELNTLKEENLKNISKISGLESQIKKCSNKYQLNNLDKITIQLNALEKNI